MLAAWGKFYFRIGFLSLTGGSFLRGALFIRRCIITLKGWRCRFYWFFCWFLFVSIFFKRVECAING